MYEWQRQIQAIVDKIDECIKTCDDEALTLRALARELGYSEFHTTRKFKEIAGMPLRDYLRSRKLAFALKEVRDTDKSLLDIALAHGFSSHEAFTRAFKAAYGVTPREFRERPRPVVLRTKINPFDRYLLGLGEIGMTKSNDGVETYFVTIPAHKFLHVKNYESNGYWDFWQKQNAIPGQDYDTICGLLDSIKGKLDDDGGSEVNSGSGQLMAYMWDPEGRLCDWGIPRIECYGVRLPADWQGEVPPNLQLIDVPEAEYLVFEHGPFDYEQENRTVEEKIERAMAEFDFEGTGYCYDETPGRVLYFYFNPARCWKYVRPVSRIEG
ncbi:MULTISPECIES: helix-turn-helix transcriptional regulator [Gordonibacter]|uniref:Helix-turn-helix transcriptional regulator n=1 Tax=Gordonibacter faecis TaxID=3047475 RepID=A0ABT7DNV6_9ACTN|nr:MULTISPECIES: helix-turn-helix transcriptional regulator [unclassified Gordonibacter]MDJ1649835.1 helix-turn-helix transcriptional regulator [Gordonibacter sp. KGMB12511]